jgi:hypothetical protein
LFNQCSCQVTWTYDGVTGKLTHSQPIVRVWTPAAGWTDLAVLRSSFAR